MRKVRTILFALASAAILLANAQEEAEDNGSFDSKLKVLGFLNKPALSANARKSRAIDSKLAVESESPSGHDSLPLIRGSRSAEDSEDNETVVATTSLPLENDDFTPNYASSTSTAEVESNPITTADPESSEKDKAAGDNTSMPNSTPTPIEVADNDEDEVKAEHKAVSSSEELPATQASEHEASSSEAVPAIQALSEQPTPSSEDVQGRSMPDIEALEQMHPDLAPSSSPSQDIDVQPSASSLDVNESTPMISSPASMSSVERVESEAPVSSSSPASGEREEGTTVPSVSPTSEEQAPPAAASEESKPESDVKQDLQTTTLINVADPTSDDASAEKTSPSEETTEEIEDNFPNLETSENEDIDEVTTEDDEDDGPTDATFEEPTGSPADGESTEETVPTAPESSVAATGTSSTPTPSSKYDFLLYDESNVACILASMSITLRVTYTTKDKKTRTKSIQVPSTASVSGFCGEKDSNMTLSWPTSDTSLEQKDSITFMMKKDDSKFYVSSVQVSLVPNNQDFPNVIGESLRGNSATDLRLFSAHLKNGAHVCRPMTEVTCGQIVVLIKDVSLIAYNDRDSLADREEERCSPPPKSISIAAVVGAIVGLTVTIGIVASYAWYRKRTSTFRSELP